jgi:hypothetical protein
MCLRGAKAGGSSRLISGATSYNEILRRRPDLAPLLFQTWYWDWKAQDRDAPADCPSPHTSHARRGALKDGR